MKMIKIADKIHRAIAIQAAKDGVTITSIVERAAIEELAKIRAARRKSRKPQTVTSDGSPVGA